MASMTSENRKCVCVCVCAHARPRMCTHLLVLSTVHRTETRWNLVTSKVHTEEDSRKEGDKRLKK